MRMKTVNVHDDSIVYTETTGKGNRNVIKHATRLFTFKIPVVYSPYPKVIEGTDTQYCPYCKKQESLAYKILSNGTSITRYECGLEIKLKKSSEQPTETATEQPTETATEQSTETATEQPTETPKRKRGK